MNKAFSTCDTDPDDDDDGGGDGDDEELSSACFGSLPGMFCAMVPDLSVSAVWC